MHMGFFGPRRIACDDDGQATQFPIVIEDNEYSILDITDLVFIDPVGTGYSKPVEGAELADFIGYENDNRTVGDFIRLYVSRYGRWASPKYVSGESYGTIRAVGLCKYLSEKYALGLNGIMLVSSINDFTTIMEDTPSDYSYALYLPTYAADAWYHGKLAPQYQQMKLEDYLAEVRSFAGGEYLAALFAGRRLDEAKRKEIAARIAAYAGIDEQDVLLANLRVPYVDFCGKLLKDQKLVIGRIDGRYTGPVTGGSMASGDSDPSSAALGDVFGTAVNQYIIDELDFHTDRPYEPLSLEVNEKWNYPGAPVGFSQQQIIYEMMSKNRFLKVWVLCGYYDLSTPFFAAEWIYSHVFLEGKCKDNLKLTYYPSGHMIYMHEPSLKAFREQAKAFYH
jgi:carboxypeptidase C (cathepsin A)